MRILILSPFKTATTSLYVTFKERYIDTLKLHDFDHTFHTDYTHVFLISRNKQDLYMSAFFQDIDNSEFPYYFGTKQEILDATIDTLIDHFKSVSWSQYNHLNIEYYESLLEKYFDVKLDTDKEYNIVKKKDTYFIHVQLEHLSELFATICNLVDIPEITLQNHNSNEYKWYSDIYRQFKLKLK